MMDDIGGNKISDDIPVEGHEQGSGDVFGDVRLREAIASMNDGIAIYGPSGHLEYCNDSFRQFQGYSETDTQFGVATYDSLGKLDAANQVIEHKLLSFAERLDQLRRDGANLVLQYHGDRIYERRQSATPSGGMINLITDITKHHRLEIVQQGRNNILELVAKGHPLQEVLTELIKNCEALFPGMLGSVLLMDETGTRLLAGAAPSLPKSYTEAIHGVEIGDNIGSCGTAAYRKETVIVSDIATHPYWTEISELALDAGLKASWSQPIFASDGNVLGTFAMYYKEIRSPSDAELSFIKETANLAGIAIEFYQKETALRAAVSNAELASKAKSEFLAMMSHELRTPLNAILGFSDMLRGAHLGDINSQSYQEYASDIHKSGQHLLGLIDDVLDISAIEAGKRVLQKEKVDVKDLLDDCFRSFLPQAKENRINISYTIADAVQHIYADLRSVKQIILNLVSNAVKFTENNGEIAVSVKKADEYTIIEVRDTGVGIPAETLLHITEPFTQGHANPMLSQKGYGLGLSIVKQLVMAHDGTVKLQSEVGTGTTAIVVLPDGVPD
ncbi:ATP-binding protein [Rhodospirillales bacterium]|nr:ATP-binding protein [Rhodospirillales bacterium]